MTLGEWIPIYLDAYKRDTIRPDSFYTIQLVAGKIPPDILAMELTEIRPMHLQRFVNAFGLTASKSYMDKLHVLLNAVFEAAMDMPLFNAFLSCCLVSSMACTSFCWLSLLYQLPPGYARKSIRFRYFPLDTI